MKSKLTSIMIFSVALLGVVFVSNSSLAAVSIDTGFSFSGGGFNVNLGFGSGGGGWMLPNPNGLPTGSIYNIVSGILTWLLMILGIVGIIGFAISGIMYLISAGNDTMAEKAKKSMLYSIIGVVVGLSGYVAIKAIDAMLNARLF